MQLRETTASSAERTLGCCLIGIKTAHDRAWTRRACPGLAVRPVDGVGCGSGLRALSSQRHAERIQHNGP